MATVGVAIVHSWGGRELGNAITSAKEADEILVILPPGSSASGPSAGEARAQGEDVTFVEGPWGHFPAIAEAARRRSRSDWLIAIDESERLDEELRSSLRSLRASAPRTGYFLVPRRLDLFGRWITARDFRRVESSGSERREQLGILAGSVACSIASSLSGMVEAINAGSGVAAGVLYRRGQCASVLAMMRRPLSAFFKALSEVGLGRGTDAFVYATAMAYSEVATVGKVWELAHAAGSRGPLSPAKGETGEPAAAPGYVTLESGRTSVTVLRAPQVAVAECLEKADPEDCFGEPIPGGGRGAAWIVPLAGETGVLRWYRRGGLARYLMRDSYLCLRAPRRPVRELLTCVEARRRGVLVPQVLGVRIDRLAGPLYRGAILTRRVERALTLWEVLERSRDTARRREIWVEVLAAVERMHDAGVYHRDLNLRNILVKEREDSWDVWFVDFDRALAGSRPVSRRRRERAQRRMVRSMIKLASASSSSGREEILSLARSLRRKGDPSVLARP